MERKIVIKYRWWRQNGNVKQEHIETLEEDAMNHISEMMKQGFTSGQLADNIQSNDDEVEYYGHWEVNQS